MHSEKFDNIILIGLILTTILIISLQSYSLNRSLTIDATSIYLVNTVSDDSIQGGQSKATLSTENNNYILDCEIVAAEYAWPFCEIAYSFTFDKNGKVLAPLDLSSFTSVKVSAKYVGENTSSIRFQLRSFNDAFSTREAQESWKYSGIEYWPEKNNYPVQIPMKSLQVATWWLAEREIPIEHSSPEFEQVFVLELATGNDTPPGKYQLQLENIEFIGKHFSNKQVYSFVIFIWIVSAIIGLIINLNRSKHKLRRAKRRAQELKQLNRLLNVESKTLKDRAERDPLTGALNRSGIEAIFTEEIKVLSLIFIDLDHFKPINDQHGHTIGDEILVEFVKLISENCRSTDFLSRWGGEEFLLICPNTTLTEASDLAESMRLIIVKHQWANQIKLTASFGVAQKNRESASHVIDRADQALYNAKAQGRNKVVVSERTAIDSSIKF